MNRSCPTSSSVADNWSDLRSIMSPASLGSAHDLEVTHHAAGVMLENVAMVHPFAGTIIRQPRDADASLRWDVHGVLPRAERGCLAVQLHDLKEESVQVEGMVHHRVVEHVPHLKLANLDWPVA